MTSTTETLNPDWGFFGSIQHHAEPRRAWTITMRQIMAATSCADYAVRDFLDSRHGRHFADEVVSEIGSFADIEDVIALAIRKWMGWRIDKLTSREHGIPAGLPYLTGWCAFFEVEAEAAA